MGVLQATSGQMVVLFLLIAMGFIIAKLKVVPDNSDAVLSKLENNLFVPALVLGTFVSNFTVEKLSTAGKLFGISFLICFVMMALAVLVARCCSKDSFIRNIYTYCNLLFYTYKAFYFLIFFLSYSLNFFYFFYRFK